jgi:hypothetical protein
MSAVKSRAANLHVPVSNTVIGDRRPREAFQSLVGGSGPASPFLSCHSYFLVNRHKLFDILLTPTTLRLLQVWLPHSLPSFSLQ